MRARILVLTPLLAAAAAATLADRQQYDVRISGTALAVQLAMGPNGADARAQTRERSATAILSVTSADSAGVRTLAVQVDTMDQPRTAEAPGARVRGGENATGATWRGTAPDDEVHLAAAGPMSARMFDEVVLLLLPELPAELAPGAAWSDTTSFAIDAGEGRISGRTVSGYRVTGGSAATGFHVERTFRGERTSRLGAGGDQALIENEVRGTAEYRLDAAGSVASLRIVRTTDSEMHLPQVADPVTGSASDTIEIVRR